MGGNHSQKIVSEIFTLLDPDKSGSLTEEEFKLFLYAISEEKELEGITLPNNIKQIDRDGDKLVSLRELIEYFEKLKLSTEKLYVIKESIVNALDAPYAVGNGLPSDGYSTTEGGFEEDEVVDGATRTVSERKSEGRAGGEGRGGAEEAKVEGKATMMASERETGGSEKKLREEEHELGEKGGYLGPVWHAQILPPEYNNRKHCLSNGLLKPRRPRPQIRSTEFFRLLHKTKDGLWRFRTGLAGLNGWGGLNDLCLESITYKKKGVLGGKIVRSWISESEEKKNTKNKKKKEEGGEGEEEDDTPPVFPEEAKRKGFSVRATLRLPKWASIGWAQDSPGHVWWYFPAQRKVRFGVGMIEQHRRFLQRTNTDEPIAVRVHQFAHRYSQGRRKGETIKDRVVYHAGILLEWDHKRHCTVIELAYLNGISGYGGKSNWVADRNSGRPALYRAMPGVMKMPWIDTRAEIRCIDIPVTGKKGFEEYLAKYNGPGLRFLDPKVSASSDVHLSHRKQTNIMRYLCNYILSDGKYDENFRNCQDFAADLFGFLSGLPPDQCKPFHAVCRLTYTRKTYMFLYDPISPRPPQE
mmetsp:Transcript_14079/g.34345  ORF Transcript_14079/g.34345 Transcript_14079/m.34345 type:complete len:582 (-) Transcript_14079:153-1898(-)